MRILIIAGTLSLGLSLAASLPAAAETTTTTPASPSAPVRTVTVQGFASEQIAANADQATADAVYRQGMVDAIADALGKAQLLASKTEATLGPVQSIAEGGGYIQCAGSVEYEGEQPDFGNGAVTPIFAASTNKSASPGTAPVAKRKHRHRHTAKKSTASGCTLSAELTIAYQLT